MSSSTSSSPGNPTGGQDKQDSDPENSDSSSSFTSRDLNDEPNQPTFDIFPTREEALDAFYKDWKKEVHRKMMLARQQSTIPQASVNPLETSNPDHNKNSIKQDSRDVSTAGTQWLTSTLSSLLITGKENNSVTKIKSGISCSDSFKPQTDTRLYEKFINDLFKSPESRRVYAEPDLHHSSATHISALPMELLLRVFRWVVGNHLDMRMLGVLACVCRGFYILACDSSLWRAICFRTWPVLKSQSLNSTSPFSEFRLPEQFGYDSWRQMALYRPHILLNGCYLCRISYIRTGEQEFGFSYRPMFQVVYYRGLRFYPDRRVVMFTAPTNVASIVAVLGQPLAVLGSTPTFSRPNGSTLASCDESDPIQQTMNRIAAGTLLQGTYDWSDNNTIVCTLHRPNAQDEPLVVRRRRQLGPFAPNLVVTFVIKFSILSKKKQWHKILRWDSYVIHTVDKTTGFEGSTNLDLSNEHFPPCYFSRVRSYTRQLASGPL